MISIRTGREERLLKKQLEQLMIQESKFLRRENLYWKNKWNPTQEQLKQKIPPKVSETLEKAFEKAFRYLFEQGTGWIEKTYSLEKLSFSHQKYEQALSEKYSYANSLKMNLATRSRLLLNQGISAAEGTALGLLGIGIPDIPLFLGMILKTVYEICLSYGYHYETEEERRYILLVIATGVAPKEKRLSYSAQTDRLAYGLDAPVSIRENGEPIDLLIREVSGLLSQKLLLAKAIQGTPLVGAVGGAVNYKIISDVGTAASFKYKKRFLLRQTAK